MPAVVFDWDGTLVDTMPAITRANRAVLDSYGLPFEASAYRAAYSPDWQQMYVRLGVDPSRMAEAGARWLEAYGAEMRAVRAFPGAVESLERLAAAGYRLGLVTAGERHVVIDQLDATGLGRFLPVRVCAGDLPVMKPHPAPLRKALEDLGVELDPGNVYVGDATDDMRMARTVGARAVGILSDLADAADLADAGADETAVSVATWVEAFLDSPTIVR